MGKNSGLAILLPECNLKVMFVAFGLCYGAELHAVEGSKKNIYYRLMQKLRFFQICAHEFVRFPLWKTICCHKIKGVMMNGLSFSYSVVILFHRHFMARWLRNQLIHRVKSNLLTPRYSMTGRYQLVPCSWWDTNSCVVTVAVLYRGH